MTNCESVDPETGVTCMLSEHAAGTQHVRHVRWYDEPDAAESS